MYSVDLIYDGSGTQQIDVADMSNAAWILANVAASGVASPTPGQSMALCKGIRVVPVGITTETQVEAAYANLKVQCELNALRNISVYRPGDPLSNIATSHRTLMQGSGPMPGLRDDTTQTPPGTVQGFAVDGPHWFSLPGAANFTLLNGLVGQTYRFWIAETEQEMINPADSYYPGLAPSSGGGGGGGGTGNVTDYTDAALALNTVGPPFALINGALLTDATAVRVTVEAPAANTINAVGILKAWKLIAATTTWARAPELDLFIDTSGEYEGTAQLYQFPDQEVLVGSGRLAYRPSGLVLTGGGTTVAILYEVVTPA